ncbi:MAG: exo-alpha-sialidase [Pirellulaceae bacterium]|nr:exo-alpha-sialidase [Pirellulaceae bacterium]
MYSSHFRRRLLLLLCVGICPLTASATRSRAEDAALDYQIELSAITEGYDRKTCWVHPRPGVIPPHTKDNPSDMPIVVVTLNKLLLTGEDVYQATSSFRSNDMGKTWLGPTVHEKTMGRREEPGGVTVVPSDFWPAWHAATQTLLGTGHNVRYSGDRRPLKVRTKHTVYSVYDPVSDSWSARKWLTMPERDDFLHAGAGSTQRYDLPDGDILLPIYYRRPDAVNSFATIVRCRFDGEQLTYVEHGDELTVDEPRGLGEPSLTRFGERFYLTLRNNARGYVTRGTDGLHFEKPIPWTFDDGEELGSYNTQQHWVTHGEGLFLVYTRRGANNDHVFRHRAPLFIAQVDPERMCVIRSTERILVPERGARLGNFGVVHVGPHETWVTTAEWMQGPGRNAYRPESCEKYGSNNRVWLARIKWNRPNELVEPWKTK